MRERDTSSWSRERREARGRTLDDLLAYAQAGVFPAGESESGFLPTFIDDRDRRCAVAHLIEKSAGMELAREINRDYRNAFVADMKSEALVAWAGTTGLSLDELALVQPSYPPRRRDLRARVSLRHDTQIGKSATELDHLSAVETRLRWQKRRASMGTMVLALDAMAGAVDFDSLSYRLHAIVGWSMGFEIFNSVIDGVRHDSWAAGPHALGVRLGAGVDESGADIGRAMTVPAEGFYSFPTSEETRLALHLGPVLRVAGDQRPHGFRGALRFRWKRLISGLSLDKWDLHLGLAYERKAGADFAGLEIGLGKYRHDGWYIRD